nr:hypothetical protein [Tanacetum cinerariifolium]
MKTKPEVDTLNFVDLYNNLRVFESDVKGSTGSSSSTQNMAFVSSDNTSSTNEVNTAYGVSTSSCHNLQKEGSSSYTDDLMYSFFANQSSGTQLDHEDLEQVDEFDLEELHLKWQVAMISTRLKKFYKKTRRKLHFDAKEPVGIDKSKFECFNYHNTGHFARECKSKGNQDSRRKDVGNTIYKARGNGKRPAKQDEHKAMVTIDGEDTEVTSCSKVSEESYAKLKNLYDEQREQPGVTSIEIQAYTLALKKLESQLVCHQKNQLAYEEKISQMSAKDKSGLGYGSQLHEGVLSYENEVFATVFDSRSSDAEYSPVNDRFVKVEGMHASDSDDEDVTIPSKEQEKPSFAFVNTIEHVKTPRQTIKEQNTCSQNPKPNKRDWNGLVSKRMGLGYGFTIKACFVCGSFSHLIRDCDFHKKRMAKKIDLKKTKGHMTGNKSYLVDYQDFNGRHVAFKGINGQITGKGKIRTRKLDFKNRFTWVFFSTTKDETSRILKGFIRQIKNQLNQKVKTIRCDNGIEFKNKDIIKFYGSKGIKREYSNAKTPQQNEVAERKNRTLIEAARTMLANSFLPNTFWAKVVSTACYVLIRVLVKKPQNKTPYELLTGKFEEKSDEEFLVGYSLSSKAFRPVNVENKANKTTGLKKANNSAGTQDSFNAGNSKMEVDHAQEYYVLPLWSSYTSTVKSSKEKNGDEKLNEDTDSKTYEESVDHEDQVFLKELKRLKRQEKEANDAAETLRKTKKAIETKWVYRNKKDEIGFIDPKFPNKVYKVVKALYGLHQAPRAWYATLSTFLVQSIYRKGLIDKPLFIKKDKKDIMLKFDFLSVKTVSTPIETKKPLAKNEESVDVDVTPKTSHLQAVKRIFRYLKGQPKLGLWYPRESAFDVEAYSDNDYVGENLERKSTIRGCQFLGRRLISWHCKKQTIVATSTIEADAKNTSWNEFSSTMESAIICLATNQKFIFSRYILLSLVKNVEAGVPFFMFPRFIQLINNHQLGDMAHHKQIFDTPSLTKKVIANIKWVGTGFFREVTLLFDNMLVQAPEEVAEQIFPSPSNDPLPSGKDSLKLKELMDLFTNLSNKVLELESKVIDIKSTYQERIEKLEGRVERPLFEKHYNYNQAFLDEVNEGVNVLETEVRQEKDVEVESYKREGENLEQEIAKKQRMEEETGELKKYLQVVTDDDDDDDVYKDATPLASKIPIVNYKIHTERNRTYFKIIRADGNHIYGLEKVKSWKLIESCGVKCITFLTTHIFQLVERMYPLTHFTLEQMLNNVRFQVEEECKMSLELLRLVRRQLNEGYVSQ